MHYILLALILNANTGYPTALQRVGDPFDTPEACLKAQADQPIEKTKDVKVRVYLCIREDQLGEATT